MGFSSISTKQIYTKKIGKTVFVSFLIAGVSNSAALSFTVPYTSSSLRETRFLASPIDNGGSITVGYAGLDVNSNVVNSYATAAAAGFTTSGDKSVRGEFWYEAAS